ncbi:MAG: TIM barrel protein [Alistipes sp.]|nr:TIM barrel protein [Alistipes sp.]
MDRLGFFKHGFSALMDAASSAVGLKKAVESMTEAVDEALSNIQSDVCLHLPSLDAKMYEDPQNTLLEVARMGYTTLEVGAYFGDTIHDQKVDVFKDMTSRAGLKVVSAHLNREYKPEPVAEESNGEAMSEDVNDESVSEEANGESGGEKQQVEQAASDEAKPTAEQLWWTEALDTVKGLGCRSVVMARVPAFPPSEVEQMAQTYADYFSRVAELAAERDLKFCYHPSAAELRAQQDGVSFFDLIATKCDAEKLWFQIDTFEALEVGIDICSLLKQYKGRVLSLHLHDRGVVGDSEEIDFERVIKCGYDCGVQSIIVEQRHFTLPPINCVERSLQCVMALPSVRL